jgi:hypothetical protein
MISDECRAKQSIELFPRQEIRSLGNFRACFSVFIFLIALCFTFPLFAQANSPAPQRDSDTQENAPAESPPNRVARISFLKGRVSYLRAGLNQWSEAGLNFPVTTGDRIYTDTDSRAELQVGSATVRLSDSTDLTMTNLNDQIMQLGLTQGTIRLSVYRLRAGGTVEVDTPNGALTMQPGSYRVDTAPDGSSTLVTVNRGSLEITGGEISQTLQAGEAAKLIGQNPINVESVPMLEPDDFDRWCEQRDKHLSSSRSGKYVSPDIPGYDDLDDYGSWQDNADYGPVWFPAGVAVGWVPYRFGHWAWVAPWGWTWIEDEPWGFCPFHFGRWVHIGVAWGWVPGPIAVAPLFPVYAPAFVAFLGGPGFSVGFELGGVGLAAWFPLGPGEPFFPWYHWGGDYLRVVNITNVRNVTNITNITNITDIRNVHYAYKDIGTTAVNRDVFAGGKPVAHSVVSIPRDQLAKAQVIPHPAVNPTRSAAMAGRPVSTPPVRSSPLVASNRTTPGATRSSSGTVRPAERPASPAANLRTAPAAREPLETPRSTSPPGLITRAAPPERGLSFNEMNRAMFAHPGRPLEPAQIENLRAGRPVGPMVDREFPAHIAPLPRVAPAPRSHRP